MIAKIPIIGASPKLECYGMCVKYRPKLVGSKERGKGWKEDPSYLTKVIFRQIAGLPSV